MDIELFRTFVAVTETRSFSRAAEVLHWTQSTVSRRIGSLETEFGASLFNRYGRHVECTMAVEVLLPLAQATRALAQAAGPDTAREELQVS